MDPITALGLASSIIAVVQLAQAVLKNVGPSAHNKAELSRLLGLVSGFKGAYESLEYRLEYSENDESRAALLRQLEQPAKEYKVVLDYLHDRLENSNFVQLYIISSRFDKRFQKCVDRLKDQKELFELVMQADQHVMIREIKKFSQKTEEILDIVQSSVEGTGVRLDSLAQLSLDQSEEARVHYTKTEDGLKQLNTSIKAGASKEEDRLRVAHRNAVIGWLSNTDPLSSHDAAKAKRESTTGSWFIEGEAYDEWRSSDSCSFLWLHGIPGCGKSVLCSTIIEETITYCSARPGPSQSAFYYFSFADSGKQKPTNFLRSIIAQLCAQSELPIPDAVEKLYKIYGSSDPPAEALLAALKVVLEGTTNCFIFADALDECPASNGSREELCNMLVHISKWSFSSVHILATSRKEGDIEETFLGIGYLIQVPIQNAEVDADIRVYVKSQAANDAKFARWASKIETVETTLVEKAHGMFRWVFCQIETLRKCRTKNEVLKALDALPKNLDETYERILAEIDDYDRILARSALQWLVYGVEPLSVDMLAEAAILNPNKDPPFDVDDRLEPSRMILHVLSSLVSTYFDNGVEYVDIAHFSVQEYLVSYRVPSKLTHFFRMDELACHQAIAQSCLHYINYYGTRTSDDLSKDISKSDDDSDWEMEIDPGNYVLDLPIIHYCAFNWKVHAQACEGTEYDCTNLICEFLDNDSWLEALTSLCRELKAPPIYWAAACGLYSVVKRLLDSGVEVNARGGWCETALQVACRNCTAKNERIVGLLLDEGADPNIQGGYFENALQATCSTYDGDLLHTPSSTYDQRDSIVRRLLEKNADVNAPSDYYGRVLIVAIMYRRDLVARLLIEKGADVNAPAGIHGNTLHTACAIRNLPIVLLLLQSGAAVNAEGGPYGNAFRAALMDWADSDNFQLIQNLAEILIAYGATFDAEGDEEMSEAFIAKDYTLLGHLLRTKFWQETQAKWHKDGKTDNIEFDDDGQNSFHIAGPQPLRRAFTAGF